LPDDGGAGRIGPIAVADVFQNMNQQCLINEDHRKNPDSAVCRQIGVKPDAASARVMLVPLPPKSS